MSVYPGSLRTAPRPATTCTVRKSVAQTDFGRTCHSVRPRRRVRRLRWSLRPPGRATLYRRDAAAARNPLRRCSRGRSRRGNDRSSFLDCGVHENRCTTPSLRGGRRRTAERTRSRGTAVLVPGGACHASHHGVKQPFAPPRGPRSDVGTSSTPPHLPVTHPPRTATTNPLTCQVARCVDVAAPPRRAMAVGTWPRDGCRYPASPRDGCRYRVRARTRRDTGGVGEFYSSTSALMA